MFFLPISLQISTQARVLISHVSLGSKKTGLLSSAVSDQGNVEVPRSGSLHRQRRLRLGTRHDGLVVSGSYGTPRRPGFHQIRSFGLCNSRYQGERGVSGPVGDLGSQGSRSSRRGDQETTVWTPHSSRRRRRPRCVSVQLGCSRYQRPLPTSGWRMDAATHLDRCYRNEEFVHIRRPRGEHSFLAKRELRDTLRIVTEDILVESVYEMVLVVRCAASADPGCVPGHSSTAFLSVSLDEVSFLSGWFRPPCRARRVSSQFDSVQEKIGLI